MTQDLVVNLTVGGAPRRGRALRDFHRRIVGAHVAGVAFAYEPAIPPTIMGTIPASLIEGQRAENDKAAADAIARFDEAPSGRSFVPVPDNERERSRRGRRFGAMARRFGDLAGSASPIPTPSSPTR